MAVLMLQQHAERRRRSDQTKGGPKAALLLLARGVLSRRVQAIRLELRHPHTAAVPKALSNRRSNLHGTSRTLPVVSRASSARCADVASRSGTSRSTRTRSFFPLIQVNNSPARQFNSSYVAE